MELDHVKLLLKLRVEKKQRIDLQSCLRFTLQSALTHSNQGCIFLLINSDTSGVLLPTSCAHPIFEAVAWGAGQFAERLGERDEDDDGWAPPL